MGSDEIRLGVGDVVMSLVVEEGIHLGGYAASYVERAPAEVTVDFALRDESLVPPGPGSFLGGIWGWNAHLLEGGKSMITTPVSGGTQIHLPLDPPGTRARVLLSSKRSAESEPAAGARELALVEVLPLPAVWALSEREGILLHTCGVAHEGQGLIFMGVSGSGKTTLAALWEAHGDPRSFVINDEHAIVSCRNGAPRLYGAPWVRGGIEAQQARVPVRAIFFLVHGQRNLCVPLSLADGLARLLSQVFLPVWDQRQMNLAMATCSDLVCRVPVYQLEFVPEPAVVGFVRDIVERM